MRVILFVFCHGGFSFIDFFYFTLYYGMILELTLEYWGLLPTKVRLVKAMVFPVVMYGCES